jgi:alkyl hydroperoxide reductase subunit AhpC
MLGTALFAKAMDILIATKRRASRAFFIVSRENPIRGISLSSGNHAMTIRGWLRRTFGAALSVNQAARKAPP